MSCAVVLLVGVQWIGFTHPWLISTLNIDLLWLLLPLLCCGTLKASLRPICLLLLVLTIGLFAQSESLGKDPECFDQCALVGTIIGVKSLADLNQISLSVAPARLGAQVTRLEPLRVRAGLEAKTRKVGESITAVIRLTRGTSNVNFYQATWFGHQFAPNWGVQNLFALMRYLSSVARCWFVRSRNGVMRLAHRRSLQSFREH